ncbi:MAG: YesL family protein [Oscillospiraceae bacterium]|nr:YesL family protein [Oscillospiraceae bacterium]MDD4367968.1 YesL family protein [Oscillospiraceae bacterium]
MAGFFGLFDFTKEGPGVDPDAPPKGPVATFFGILGRKFWKVCTISLMYSLFSLLSFVLAFLVSSYLLQLLFPGMTLDNLNQIFADAQLNEGVTVSDLSSMVILGITVLVMGLLIGLAYVVTGPIQAGVTYLMRNYGREEHAFVWSDFWEHARKNWKQSTITCLLSLAASFLLPVAFVFYRRTISNGILRTLLSTVIVLLFICITFMLMYVYQMMITFDLKLKDIYRNAFLFFILRLPFNFLILLAQLLILLVIPALLLYFLSRLGLLLTVVYYVVFAFGCNLLLVNFFINRQIQRYMIKPMQETAEAEAAEEDEAEEEEAEPETAEDQAPEEAPDDNSAEGHESRQPAPDQSGRKAPGQLPAPEGSPA